MTFWSNRKEKFNPSILKSLEDLTHLTEYDWAGAILSRMYDDMCDLSRGHWLVPLAWRWYRANHRSVLRKKSLGDLRTFFDTCTMEQSSTLSNKKQYGSQSDMDPPPLVNKAQGSMENNVGDPLVLPSGPTTWICAKRYGAAMSSYI
ncbi:hypothetical protein JCGZ_03259 [Jatropha curcas]|uniref:Aminotransferase-like plant mobile domain-containing protein n=1 Tax=Jatropha curcas TaxID=180498 RepID=A0A067JD75_JATCU|nr:hypothetical protein JCGZ_03259 [Jatropha curcas]